MQPRDLQRPLDRGELSDLSAFLASSPGAMPFLEAHGFLTAIASAPTTVMPSAWQPMLLGERGFGSMEQAQQVSGLVIRLYNQVIAALEEGVPVVSPGLDDEGLKLWCAGYLAAARRDEVWMGDAERAALLAPLAVLAGEVELVEDPAARRKASRAGLNATVHEANRYWTAWRRKRMAPPVVARAPKVGRNDPCPCGSGLKFKKCCALKEA